MRQIFDPRSKEEKDWHDKHFLGNRECNVMLGNINGCKFCLELPEDCECSRGGTRKAITEGTEVRIVDEGGS